MERHLPSTESQDTVKTSTIMGYLCDTNSSSLQPRSPKHSTKLSSGPRATQLKKRESPARLSPAKISLTMHVEDIAKSISSQLDSESECKGGFTRLEERFSEVSFDFRNTIFKTEESDTRTKIVKIFKQVLKKCGYILAATVAVPLIAGKIRFFFFLL